MPGAQLSRASSCLPPHGVSALPTAPRRCPRFPLPLSSLTFPSGPLSRKNRAPPSELADADRRTRGHRHHLASPNCPRAPPHLLLPPRRSSRPRTRYFIATVAVSVTGHRGSSSVDSPLPMRPRAHQPPLQTRREPLFFPPLLSCPRSSPCFLPTAAESFSPPAVATAAQAHHGARHRAQHITWRP